MSRDWQLYLDDMRDCCRKIIRFTAGMDQTAFIDDAKTRDAVLHNIEIIGEAAKYVPEDVRARLPFIEWRKITALRNLIAHAYFGVDDAIVWDIVQNKVPELLRDLQEIESD